MNRLRFTKVRQVTTPSRGNVGDAGLDFYIPDNLSPEDMVLKNSSIVTMPNQSLVFNPDLPKNNVICVYNPDYKMEALIIPPLHRVLIPSGIRVLMEPANSMLTAANKSGIATKLGLIYTAQIVDSPYTGEVHIGVLNTSRDFVILKPGQKLTQFIHIPIFDTTPEEISNDEYDKLSENWGTRGNNGFGSTGE